MMHTADTKDLLAGIYSKSFTFVLNQIEHLLIKGSRIETNLVT